VAVVAYYCIFCESSKDAETVVAFPGSR
jgi:hypothetical protein